jgi:predicted HicB family RNase H-like nuclease
MKYRGFEAIIRADPEDALVYGRGINIGDAVCFHADDMDGIEAAFHEAVDHYLLTINDVGAE